MEKAQLLPALFSNNEKGIREVKNLRDVEDIENESDGRVDLVELIAGKQGVS